MKSPQNKGGPIHLHYWIFHLACAFLDVTCPQSDIPISLVSKLVLLFKKAQMDLAEVSAIRYSL